MAEEAPVFSLARPRYDQSTYLGRAKHFYEVTDPRTLFYSDKDLQEALELLDDFRVGGGAAVTASNEELWDARRIKDSMTHPDTGEVIPHLLRFSAFGPVNFCIVPTMMMPSVIASVPKTIGAHFVNQSYNGAVNFANRNANSDIETSTLAFAYGAAVVSSISIALGATKAMRKFGSSAILRATLPYSAVVIAGCANVTLVRSAELTQGVQIEDGDGNVLGESVIAAKHGLAKCCAARAIWNFPCMCVPPIVMSAMPLAGISAMVFEVALTCGLIIGCVPGALAVFPQRDTIDLKDLEPEYQGLKDSEGTPIQFVYFNKGL